MYNKTDFFSMETFMGLFYSEDMNLIGQKNCTMQPLGTGGILISEEIRLFLHKLKRDE